MFNAKDMKISQAGIDFIHKFEGVRLKAYKPVAAEKFWTIGWGHYGPDVKEGQVITRQQADDMFKKDIVRYENAVRQHVKVPITQNQYDMLTSFAYNCGTEALRTSLLLTKLNRGDVQGAADEFPRWNKGSGQVLAGLVRRRAEERAIFLTPDRKGVATVEIKELKPIALSPNQEKDRALLAKHGIMAADYQIYTGEGIAMLTMMAALVRKIENRQI